MRYSVWGFHKAPDVDIVHLQYCKKVLGVKQSTQNDFVYGDLGRINFQSRRYLIILKFWLKVVSSEETKYMKQINDMTIHPRKQNWASCVKHLLSRLGFLEVWEAQGVGNIKAFLNIFKQRVKDNFKIRKIFKGKMLFNICKFSIPKILRCCQHC